MKKFWNWTNQSQTETQPEQRILTLNGTIAEESWFDDDVTPQLFRDELESGGGDITVWINSPGGDCIAAAQIYNMLSDYKGHITVKIDGIAASAASVIAMAGDEVLMSPVAMMMIHNPATIAMGDHAEMQKAIDMLTEVKESIINAYEEKTHLSRAKIAKMMTEETWLNAKKALQLGFVDGILFTDKKDKPQAEPDEEEENDEPLKTEPTEEPDENEEEQKPDKQRKTPDSMIYSPSKTTASLMQKISASAPKGVPINQLDKRLALLK